MDNKISIIIRTYNESRHIGDVLESIVCQKYPNYEVVIVDSCSTDSTLDIIDKYSKKIKNFKIVKIKKEEFNYSYASNIGVSNSSGNIVLFISGHSILIKNNYLNLLNKIFGDESVYGCYGDEIPFFRGGGFYEKSFYLLGYFKNFLKPFYYDEDIHPGILSCSNAAIRKKVFDEHKFVEQLGKGGEDVEMAKYILNKGWKIAFSRKLLVKHSHHKNNKAFKEELSKWKVLYNDALSYIKTHY